MTTFFTSDHHFGHANILKYEDEKRRNMHGGRFASIEKHDDYLIDQWNAIVSPDDLVYCLGDISYKQFTLENVLPRMNGEKILIVGNHDPYFKPLNIPRKTKMHHEAYMDACRAGFKDVSVRLDIEIEGIGEVCLSHFPYWPVNTEGLPDYDLRYQEFRPVVDPTSALLLCGHVHSPWKWQVDKGRPPMLNVGIDAWNMRPVSEAQIVETYMENMK